MNSYNKPPKKFHLSQLTKHFFFTVRKRQINSKYVLSKEKILKNGHYREGFLHKKDEDLEQCAKRELSEETGIKAAKIKQFKKFYSDPDRDDRDRTISIAYIAIQSSEKIKIQKAGTDAKKASWYTIDKIPNNLAFDHNKIIKDALVYLSNLIKNNPELILPFLNKEYTIDEVRQIFEIVVGPDKKFSDRRNFPRWIRNQNIIQPTGRHKKKVIMHLQCYMKGLNK